MARSDADRPCPPPIATTLSATVLARYPSAASFVHVAMHDGRFEALPSQELTDLFGEHHRAVVTTGTTHRDRQIRLAFVHVVGQEEGQQFVEFGEELLGVGLL